MVGPYEPPLGPRLEDLLFALWIFIRLEDVFKFQFPEDIRNNFPRVYVSGSPLVS